MKLLKFIMCVVLAFYAVIGHALDEYASEADAEAIVKKAVEHIKKDPHAAYADFSGKRPGWIDRDLYLVVYSMDGTVLAHGQKEGLVGKNLLEVKDPDGKAFIKDRIELAKTQAYFWQEYKFTDPLTQKVENKKAYCERISDTVVCSGIYLRNKK